MQSLYISAGSTFGYPETVTVKRCPDGTYIYYALMYIEQTINGIKERSLCSLKSDRLSFDRDLSMEMSITTDTIDYFSGGVKLWQESMAKHLVHTLSFKTVGKRDVLFTLTVMEKGDENMNYNIFETPESYEVQVVAPGYDAEELSVYLEDGVIRVRAKPRPENEENKDVLVRNFAKQKQEIEVYLPNSENASAEMKNGILYITAPKKTKGVRVEIKTA